MSIIVDNILDLILLVMLAVMIGYCIVLSRRLKAFNNIKMEMAQIIEQLNLSTAQAQKSIGEFKNIVVDEEKKLELKLKEAAEMADELDMINQTGSNLADRIERGLTGNKPEPVQSNSAENVQAESSGDKISLSDLDSQQAPVEDAEELRESLRNVR